MWCRMYDKCILDQFYVMINFYVLSSYIQFKCVISLKSINLCSKVKIGPSQDELKKMNDLHFPSSVNMASELGIETSEFNILSLPTS